MGMFYRRSFLPKGEAPKAGAVDAPKGEAAGAAPNGVEPKAGVEAIVQNRKKNMWDRLTAASVCGKFGKKIKKFSLQLIEHNLAHVIATDAHNTTSRGFCLKEAYEIVGKELGNEARYRLMENAGFLIDGQVLDTDPPEHIKRNKIFGLF